jgi:hypothetical protein
MRTKPLAAGRDLVTMMAVGISEQREVHDEPQFAENRWSQVG